MPTYMRAFKRFASYLFVRERYVYDVQEWAHVTGRTFQDEMDREAYVLGDAAEREARRILEETEPPCNAAGMWHCWPMITKPDGYGTEREALADALRAFVGDEQ